MLTAVWDGGGDGMSWGDAQNWFNDQVPVQDEEVILELAAGVQVEVDVPVPPLSRLSLSGPMAALRMVNQELFVSGTATIDQSTVVLINSSWTTESSLTNNGQIVFEGQSYLGGVVNNQGTIDSTLLPDAGRLTIGGSLFHAPPAVLSLSLSNADPTFGYDQINVQGNAALLGTVSVQPAADAMVTACESFPLMLFGNVPDAVAPMGSVVMGDDLELRPVVTASALTYYAANPLIPINVSPTQLTLADGSADRYRICLGATPADVVNVVPQPSPQLLVDSSVLQFDPRRPMSLLPQTVAVVHRTGQTTVDGLLPSIAHQSASHDFVFSSESSPSLMLPELTVVISDTPAPVADQFEPNDSLEDATDLGLLDQTLTDLTLHENSNEDWFQWTAPARGRFSVDAFFLHESGDLDVQIYDGSGSVLAWSATRTDNEHVIVSARPGETFWVRIFGFHGDRQERYDLSLKLAPDLPRVYVAAGNSLESFRIDGEPTGTIQHARLESASLGDVELGPGGLIYVGIQTELGRDILEFLPDGTLSRSFVVPDFVTDDGILSSGFGFELLADDSLLVTDDGAGVIASLSLLDGSFQILQTGLPGVADATVLENRRLVFSSATSGGAGFNANVQGDAWQARPTEHRVVRLGPLGAELESRSLAVSLDPQDVQSIQRDELLVVSQTANGLGSLQRLDTASIVLTSVDLAGPIGGLAVWEFDDPAPVPRPDEDGDGLLDEWEIKGLDVNQDGVIDLDLPALGADPRRKDVFVEIDAMLGRAPNAFAHTTAAVLARGLSTGTVLDRVVDAFLSAPVSNPDGSTGIDLHILLDEQDVPRVGFATRWNEFDAIKNGTDLLRTTGRFGTAQERNADNWPFIDMAKRSVYRYALFADEIDGSRRSGVGELPGDDLMITLGNWSTPGGTDDQQVGTFMHELGHTLGLRHGGDDDVHFKPNYFSVMNYHWQVPTSRNTGWSLDFSHQLLDPLDELQLSETAGVGFPVGGTFEQRRVQVGPLPFQQVPLAGSVDWNRDGDIAANGIVADINRGFADRNGDGLVNSLDETPGELLRGHTDWTSLRFEFTDLQNVRIYDDGDKDRPEDADSDPSDLYDDDPPDFLDQGMSSNDTMEDATLLLDLETLFGLTIDDALDVDWFKLVADFTGELVVGIDSSGSSGTVLDLAVFDGSMAPQQLVSNNVDDGFAGLKVQVTPNQTYYLKVSGHASDHGLYDLFLQPGDFDHNREINATDIDMLCATARQFSHTAFYDVNGDALVDLVDLDFLVKQILETSAGDASLDGIFDSADLVQVFQAGEYEDQLQGNSGWATGDWNCDGEFESGDLVVAFQSGTYVRAAQSASVMANADDLAAAIDSWWHDHDGDESERDPRQRHERCVDK